MLSRIFSTLLACALVLCSVAGVGGVRAIRSEPPKVEIADHSLDLVLQAPTTRPTDSR